MTRQQVDFWSVWGGQTCSVLGTSTASFVLALHVLSTTGSATLLGWIFAAVAAGTIFFAPVAGRIIAGLGHRYSVIAANLVAAGCAVGLGWLIQAHQFWPPAVVALVCVAACANGVVTLALSSSVRLTRPESDLLRVNVATALLDRAPFLVAPALAAAALPWVDVTWFFFGDAATSVLSAGVVLVSGWSRKPPATNQQTRSITAGFRFIARTPGFARLQMVYAILNGLNGVGAAVLVAAIHHSAVAHQAPAASWLAATQLAGAVSFIVCSVVLARFTPTNHRYLLFLGGLALAALLGRGLFGLTGVLFVLAAACAFRNIGLALSGPPVTALWQEYVPNSLQASVAAARRVLGQGPYPVCVMIGGVIADAALRFGAPAGETYRFVIAGAGIAELLVVAAAWLIVPRALFTTPTPSALRSQPSTG